MECLHLSHTLEGHSDRVWNAEWSPNGDLLASCGGDKSIRLWAFINNQWLSKTLEGQHERTVRRVTFSPNGLYLAAAAFDSTCTIWENINGDWKQISTLEGHENEVKSVAFNSKGDLLATCSRDKTVWIWEMGSEKEFECISVCAGHSQDVKAVLWHPTEEILFSASYDDTIKIWINVGEDWICQQTLTGHTSTVWDIAFDFTGRFLASVSDDKNLIIWECRNMSTQGSDEMDVDGGKYKDSKWELVQKIEGVHTRTIFSVDWSKADIIATGASDDSIRLFKRDPSTKQFTLHNVKKKAHGNFDINSVSWNPKNPQILATGGDDSNIKLWVAQN